MYIRPVAVALLVAALALPLLACGGSDGPGSPQANDAPGTLIFTRPDGIYAFGVESGGLTPLIVPDEPNSFVLDPAVSADGERLAFIKQPPPKVDGARYDAGSDLWVANRDGTEPRLLFAHVVPNQLVRFPQWDANGALYAIVQEIETTDGITSVVYLLQRFDVETGARETVLRDVLAYTLSPDGQRVAYAKYTRDTGEAFEAVDLSGGAPVTLVAKSENLAPFNSPRFSPDGSQIAFASADQTGATLGERYVLRGYLPGTRRPLEPSADGLPQDIWTVPAAGGRPVRVADLKEDLPALTWNGDGTKIYVLGNAGLYEVNLGNGATTRIGDGAFHGQIIWTPR